MATSKTTIEQFHERDRSAKDKNSDMVSRAVRGDRAQTLQTQRYMSKYCMVKREPND